MTRSWLFVWSDGRSEVCICRCNKHGRPIPSSEPFGIGGATDRPSMSVALDAYLDGGPGPTSDVVERLRNLANNFEADLVESRRRVAAGAHW